MTAFIRIAFAAIMVGLNTLVHTTPLLLLSLIKLAIPAESARAKISHWLTCLAESWISVNSWMIHQLTPTRISIHGDTRTLDPNARLLVLCNHASWCDIPLLQFAFNRKIPLLRFFLKQQLIWVPVLGLAWWALDFPFMKRHSREELEKDPSLRGRDLEITRKACAKFAKVPVSIMNFVEGTRFTHAKHALQKSPYQFLLKPRAGGVGAALDAMSGKLHSVLDVTLIYLKPKPSLANLLAGKLGDVEIHIKSHAIPSELASGGDYENDESYRHHCQQWINRLWKEKDALIAYRLRVADETHANA